MFRWLTDLFNKKPNDNYENIKRKDLKTARPTYTPTLNIPPSSTYRAQRSEPPKIQPRAAMNRDSPSKTSRRRDDDSSTSSTYVDTTPFPSFVHRVDTAAHDTSPTIKSGGGGEFGGGGATGNFGGSSCKSKSIASGFSDGGSCAAGDGGGGGGGDGGGGGGGDCHSELAHDVIYASLQRRAGSRTLFPS